MSQREVMLVLAHAMACPMCRHRLFDDPNTVLRGRNLSSGEKEGLAKLTNEDFMTPELLARSTGTKVEDLRTYADHPVARLRHF